ncbi:hypothetical protein Pint_09344 [Pistacia integerrima]|uniref:Uncharacterized protein n=1 Tax=Pistacia integerrima TaxID=434235 RepID=A0ACC0Y0K8_9ROSI|nr:hypothetical protein Pint_09344 [Pistacia integerrima]
MSRCFPYRDLVSVRNGASGEALIQTIKPFVLKCYSGASKLRSEKGKPKTDFRKEKKREKKEKRKERKESEKEKLYREAEKPSKEKFSWGGGCLVKGSEDEETERLEKSGLTDEHDEPVCRQNLCYLSDGTQSSNKRKRDSPPSSGITVNRNILRIKLPSQKQREADASRSEEQSCSTSGRGPVSNAEHNEIVGRQCPRTNNTKGEVSAISDSMRKENTHYDIQTEAGATKHGNYNKESNCYNGLMGEWIPLPLQPDDSEDLEWLFGAKAKQQGSGSKRLKAGDDASCCQTLWPSSQYLQGEDMYALPYTIPF